MIKEGDILEVFYRKWQGKEWHGEQIDEILYNGQEISLEYAKELLGEGFVMLEKASKEKKRVPPSVIIYGPEGCGKSTFAAGANNPYCIDVEGGLEQIEVARIDRVKKSEEVLTQLDALLTEKHDYKTVIIDSLDEMERLKFGEIMADNGDKPMNKVMGGYGAGVSKASSYFIKVRDKMNELRSRGILTIYVAHSVVYDHLDTEIGKYKRVNVALHPRIRPIFTDDCYCCLYLDKKKVVYGKEDNITIKPVGKNGGIRYLRTIDTPAIFAKNKFNLPEEIDLPDQPEKMWSVFVDVLKSCMEDKKNG